MRIYAQGASVALSVGAPPAASRSRRKTVGSVNSRPGGRHRMNGEIVVGDRTVTWAPHYARVQPRSVSSAPDPCAPRVVAGRYRVTRLLGTGGMGAVWLAQDLVLRRIVALKHVVDRVGEDTSNAIREARSAARVAHPAVVFVYDVLREDDGAWIVMEALPGQPLSTRIRQRGRLPVDEVVSIALQVLSALQAIHEAGLVHRDVKPSNLQICDADRVVLTDFGLSTPPGVWGGLRVGAVAGSLPFLAPESILDGHFGPTSDLYALGVTLYWAVEGRPPFDPGTPLTAAAVSSRAPQPTAYAGCLVAVLRGLLEHDPVRRLDVAGARSQLHAAVSGLGWMRRPELSEAFA
jgi:serine/threonine protein kinase